MRCIWSNDSGHAGWPGQKLASLTGGSVNPFVVKVLVGADRLRLYTAMRSAWDTAVERRVFRIIVIRGPEGSGGTAMLQARYQHCAMMQPRPRYWPRELVAEQAVEEVRRYVRSETLFPF